MERIAFTNIVLFVSFLEKGAGETFFSKKVSPAKTFQKNKQKNNGAPEYRTSRC